MTARLLLALLVAATPMAAGADDLPPVHFGSSSASLTSRGYERLHAVAAAMQVDPAMKLEIGGYADASGDAQSNLTLSAARARAARDFLVGVGVDGGRLTVKGYGQAQALNDNSTQELRSYNRRVQFRRLD
jgi:outer membrane protein OmpA-like peptidoglycan-associated protein